ncbi:hypothetical protein [Kitasatospora phosalacinea]|uniref:Uncharacterized protein n=1 Tax=Kitasatospora phosalacinea TaxID=2065 RepID=A0ABW6GRW3_9ACTN
MGFINNVKGLSAGKEAADAYANGDTVFVFKAIEANFKSLATGPMPGMAEQIQSIEAAGWRLDQMTAAEGKALGGERIALVLLFRRA